MKNDDRLNITIPFAYKERLRIGAEDRGVSMSKALRQAIALWCGASDKERIRREAEFEIELLQDKKS